MWLVVAMPRVPEIAIIIDLEWALKHHHETFSGIQQCLKTHGWRFSVWGKLPEVLKKRGQDRFDGVIGRIGEEDAEIAKSAGIPVVNVWLSSPAKGLVTVCQDEGKAGRMSAAHLMARGIRRLAYLGERGARYCREQLTQFREVAKEADVPVDHLLISRGTIFHQNVGQDMHDQLMRWISELEPPFGVFASTDMYARNLANAVLELGLRFPDDVAIV